MSSKYRLCLVCGHHIPRGDAVVGGYHRACFSEQAEGFEVFYLIFRKCESVRIYDDREIIRDQARWSFGTRSPEARYMVGITTRGPDRTSIQFTGDDLPELLDQVWQEVNR